MLVAAADASVRADPFDALRQRIRAMRVRENVPSVAVAVARDGKILWEQGFGWADREKRIRADQHTMYSLASISKPITATGLMVLVERGKIDLDRPVNDYLGDAKIRSPMGAAADATVWRLATHSSGLPLHFQFFYTDEPYRRPPMDETIRRYGVLVNRPGETYQYSNLGYGILDYVIERSSGMSFAEFMRREVFVPLDMTHSSVDIGPGLEQYQAIRYGADQAPIPFYTFDHPGASAVYSSAHDLVRFGMFHLGQPPADQKAILSDASIQRMQHETVEIGDGRKYGIGWAVSPDQFGYHTVGHDGGMGGVRTRLIMVPDEKIVVVVLYNSGRTLSISLADEILSILLPDYAKRRREAKTARDKKEPQSPAQFKPTEELLGRWKGRIDTYMGVRPIELCFKPSGDVHVQLAGQLKTLLNDVRFAGGRLSGVFAGDIGTPDANRRPYHLRLNVRLRDKKILSGSVTAISLPGRRAGNGLSYWIELNKQM